MTLDDAIYDWLTGGGTQTGALIGSRLYPLQLPQNSTLPAMTYQQIDSGLTATGQSEPGDLEEALVQFDCYAASHRAAKALAKALRADLNGYKGELPAGAAGGLPVGACHFRREYDFWGATAGVWRVTVEFRFLFNCQ